MPLTGNRTLAILRKAEDEGYGILAQTWYACSEPFDSPAPSFTFNVLPRKLHMRYAYQL